MNSGLTQNLVNKLTNRINGLFSADYTNYHVLLIHFWKFLESNPILSGIIEELKSRVPSAEKSADEVVCKRKPLRGEDELEHAAISYFVLHKCVESGENRPHIEVEVMVLYKLSVSATDLSYFNELFLKPLYDYLVEHITDDIVALMLLRRYKHKCEWFNRDYLYNLWSQDQKTGERLLAFHMYEYLYDQGLEFEIEPLSAAGKADMVAAQQGDEPLIADAKVFYPAGSRGKNYIIKGFNQIYQYTVSYDEPLGYLIIFKVCEEDLKLSLGEIVQSTPMIVHNNKAIFMLTIDIFQYTKPASQRGQLKVVEIKARELIKHISNH